jgi:hypothetical protein
VTTEKLCRARVVRDEITWPCSRKPHPPDTMHQAIVSGYKGDERPHVLNWTEPALLTHNADGTDYEG